MFGEYSKEFELASVAYTDCFFHFRSTDPKAVWFCGPVHEAQKFWDGVFTNVTRSTSVLVLHPQDLGENHQEKGKKQGGSGERGKLIKVYLKPFHFVKIKNQKVDKSPMPMKNFTSEVWSCLVYLLPLS